MPSPLILVTGKHAAALDKANGQLLWDVRLPFTASAPCVLVAEHQIFIGGSGKVCALDARTGALLWENTLPGKGYNFVNLALEGLSSGPLSAQAAAIARQRAVAAGAAAGAAGAAG